MLDNLKVFTTFEIAKHCRVNHRTVLNWIKEGKLKAFRTPGNHSRIEFKDFAAFLKAYQLPIPQDYQQFITTHPKILVVDDDRAVVHLIKELLKATGLYEIDCAYDGFESGKKFVEFQPDLITLDVRMPKLGGIEVCQQIRQSPSSNHIKILIISSLNEPHEIDQALAAGANGFLGKPFKSEELISQVNCMLKERLSL